MFKIDGCFFKILICRVYSSKRKLKVASVYWSEILTQTVDEVFLEYHALIY